MQHCLQITAGGIAPSTPSVFAMACWQYRVAGPEGPPLQPSPSQAARVTRNRRRGRANPTRFARFVSALKMHVGAYFGTLLMYPS
jgi:hypothetical protein